MSLWLAAQKQTAIPVSCLEHGRWDAGHRFAAGRPVDLDLRAKVSQMVGVHARAAEPSFHSDQTDVWDEISAKEQRAAFRSPTAALHELYEREEVDLEKVVGAVPMPDSASGLAVGIDGRIVALDLFDSTETLRKQWRRLIASAASARLDHNRRVAAGLLAKAEHRYPDSGALGRMLARAKKSTANAAVNRSAGEGFDARLARSFTARPSSTEVASSTWQCSGTKLDADLSHRLLSCPAVDPAPGCHWKAMGSPSEVRLGAFGSGLCKGRDGNSSTRNSHICLDRVFGWVSTDAEQRRGSHCRP